MHITTETESCGVVTYLRTPPISITHCGASMEDPLLIAVLRAASLGLERSEPVPLACEGLHAWGRDLSVFLELLL